MERKTRETAGASDLLGRLPVFPIRLILLFQKGVQLSLYIIGFGTLTFTRRKLTQCVG